MINQIFATPPRAALLAGAAWSDSPVAPLGHYASANCACGCIYFHFFPCFFAGAGKLVRIT